LILMDAFAAAMTRPPLLVMRVTAGVPTIPTRQEWVGAPYTDLRMTDEDIIESFRRGDDRATGELYNRYGKLVFTVCMRVLRDRQRAEDAVQQTFVQAWRGASSFEAGRPVGPWLATIARRVCIDLVRQDARHRNESIEVHDGSGTPSERRDAALVALPPSGEQIEAVWRVREAVENLSPDDRTLIRMLHFDDVSVAEIATHLGIPVGTVKSRGFRIHKQLAHTLSGLADRGGDDA
jgi:RNA polymerase sigma factor (sigma-70 family)